MLNFSGILADIASSSSQNGPASRGYGLVLAGGSARGGYLIGVWKALRERGIRIDAVVGTSIGAINGVLVAMDDFDLAMQVWQTIDLTHIIQCRDPLPRPDNLFDWRNLRVVARTLLLDHAFSTDPLRQMLADHIDEPRLRQDCIPYGLMTFSITERKPLALFLDQIPEGQLVDYILASCCLPLFKSVRIDGQRLVDGSIYNNLPTEMLLSRGYRRIIEVEIGGKGRIRSFDATGIELIHIEPDSPLSGPFDLRLETRLERISRGYRDALTALDSHFAAAAASADAGGSGRMDTISGAGPDRS